MTEVSHLVPGLEQVFPSVVGNRVVWVTQGKDHREDDERNGLIDALNPHSYATNKGVVSMRKLVFVRNSLSTHER